MYSKRGSEIATKLIELFRTNRIELGLTDQYPIDSQYGVSFGATENGFPYLPAIYLDTMQAYHAYRGPTSVFTNTFKSNIVVCHADLQQLVTEVRFASLQRAEKMRELLIVNDLDGLLIDGKVNSIKETLIHFS